MSAGLGAAAARIVGLISEVHLLEAMRDEFEHLRISAEVIEDNLRIGKEVYAALPAVEFQPAQTVAEDSVVASINFESPLRGTPSVLKAGNAVLRQTGAWRVERPVIDRDVCTRCGLCFVQCPDGAISLDDEGYPVIDYDHCKGCMICRQVCPLQAIETEKETRAW